MPRSAGKMALPGQRSTCLDERPIVRPGGTPAPKHPEKGDGADSAFLHNPPHSFKCVDLGCGLVGPEPKNARKAKRVAALVAL